MKKTILIINYITLVINIALAISYATYGGLFLKAMTSFSFVFTGILNMICVKVYNITKVNVAFIMLIGMFFGMCGDVFINLEFIPGAVVFAFGHVFYFVAYNKVDRMCKKDFIGAMVLAFVTAAFLFLTPIFDFGGIVFSVVIFVYCIIISMMTSKAVMNFKRNDSVSNKFWAIGSIMFFFSDIMLVLDLFADTPKITIFLCLLTYFPAQWVLAHGVYKLSVENE